MLRTIKFGANVRPRCLGVITFESAQNGAVLFWTRISFARVCVFLDVIERFSSHNKCPHLRCIYDEKPTSASPDDMALPPENSPSVPTQRDRPVPLPLPSSLDPDFYGVDLWSDSHVVRGNEEPPAAVGDFDLDSDGSTSSSGTSDSDGYSSSE